MSDLKFYVKSLNQINLELLKLTQKKIYRLLAISGPEEFYSGQTAKNMIQDLAALGGIITLQDLANYT